MLNRNWLSKNRTIDTEGAVQQGQGKKDLISISVLDINVVTNTLYVKISIV